MTPDWRPWRTASLLAVLLLTASGAWARNGERSARTLRPAPEPTSAVSVSSTCTSEGIVVRLRSCLRPDPRLWNLPPSGAPDTSLWFRLDSIVATGMPPGTQFGGAVIRTRDSAILWGWEPDARLLPASLLKVPVAQALLDLLGRGRSFPTRAASTTPPQGGIVDGDLVLTGGGDPLLGLGGGGSLENLARGVASRGVRMVHGNLVAWDSLAGSGPLEMWPGGWDFANAAGSSGPPILGLNWNLNRPAVSAAWEDPRMTTLRAFQAALARAGVGVHGRLTVRTRVQGRPWSPGHHSLGETWSSSSVMMLREFLHESLNPVGEVMALSLGAGPGTVREVRAKAQRRLAAQVSLLAQNAGGGPVEAADASGLSRSNRASPVALARVAAHLERKGSGTAVHLLPGPGEGTLENRFGWLPSGTSLVAKTGTLHGSQGLLGILRRPSDTLAFCLIFQHAPGRARPLRAILDVLVAALAGVDLHIPSGVEFPEQLDDEMDTLPAPDSLLPHFLSPNQDETGLPGPFHPFLVSDLDPTNNRPSDVLLEFLP